MIGNNELFYQYLSEYKRLEQTYQTEPLERSALVIDCLQEINAESMTHLQAYIAHALNVIHEWYPDFDEYERYTLLFEFFDSLDLRLSDERFREFTVELGYNNKFYFRTYKYWKAASSGPESSSEEGFRSFGLCEVPPNSELIKLEDLLQTHRVNNTAPFSNSTQINIGLFPMSKDHHVSLKLTRAHERRSTYRFLADGIENKDLDTELEMIVDAISKNNIKIACLPELLICDSCIQKIEEKVKKRKITFLILIAGSYHRGKDEEMRNTMPVIIFSGETVIRRLTYSKYNRFNIRVSELFSHVGRDNFINGRGRLFTNLREATVPSSHLWDHYYVQEDILRDDRLLILNLGEIGTLGFVICKDMLPNPNLKIPLYTRFVDHLFIASLNSSARANFCRKAEDLLTSGVATYYVNARSYDPLHVSPSFVFTPPAGNKPVHISPTDDFLLHPLPVEALRRRRR